MTWIYGTIILYFVLFYIVLTYEMPFGMQITRYLRPLGPKEIDGLLVPPGKAYTLPTDHLITSKPLRSEPAPGNMVSSQAVHTYVACPKSPVTHTFYSERIAGTNNSYSCRISGHTGIYFTVRNDTRFKDLTATVTLVTE